MLNAFLYSAVAQSPLILGGLLVDRFRSRLGSSAGWVAMAQAHS